MGREKKLIKQSETLEISRSQINLNPYNPKRHTEKSVAEQKKNLVRVGYLGGITWNRRSGNLIDGHRRIKALDLYYGYNGAAETDYKVKVEAVDFDDKQEKEQMTYMALGNSKADFQLIAEYLPDIDYTNAGIDDSDLLRIQEFIPSVADVKVESFEDLISTPEKDVQDNPQAANGDNVVSDEPTDYEKKIAVKEAKQAAREKAAEKYKDLNAYITISFANHEQKRVFCEIAGVEEGCMFLDGEKMLNLIE